MKAAIYQTFKGSITIENVPDPTPEPHGAVLKVEATGLCRSDWHGWMGHDKNIKLPHVPGHEISGTVVETGKKVKNWKGGERVTLPFVCGCGHCPQCRSGNHHICDHQFQPGFTHWGSFAQYVAIHHADINLVTLPENLNFVAAASLGCRFITAFRALVKQGKVSAGQWVAVHGCGGVGLSAVMIAQALGAKVIAIDIHWEKLDLAKSIGAVAVVHAEEETNVVEAVKEISDGGVHVSMDALGNKTTCYNSILNLRKSGKHLQVGLMEAADALPNIPMREVIANELEIIGSHGMQAYEYPPLLKMVREGRLQPEKLIDRTISLEESTTELPNMNLFKGVGVKVINKF
ncbi:MAG: zinc-dependent alcohol dehydrogenase family protein [Bacteroidetes bacterium]|nr:zinc-dependent alcohol dehydrogenase family protein [Bacteroidota bacterium]